MLNSFGKSSADGSGLSRDAVVYDPCLKIKEEEESDDERLKSTPQNERKFGHILTKAAVVKLEAIDFSRYKRSVSNQNSKKTLPKQKNAPLRQESSPLLGKSPSKQIVKSKSQCKNVNGLGTKKNAQIVHANGLEKTSSSCSSPQRARLSSSNLLQNLFVANDKSANMTTNPPAFEPTLKSDDLRHVIGSHKMTVRKLILAESSSDGQESELLDDMENDLDSMSLHADDNDLELDYNEDLNELGKHFESSNQKTANQTPKKQTSTATKRRYPEKDRLSKKKRKVDSHGKEFMRSRSSGELEDTRKRHEGGELRKTPQKAGADKAGHGNVRTKRSHSDDARKGDSVRKEDESRIHAQNGPSIGNNIRNNPQGLPFHGMSTSVRPHVGNAHWTGRFTPINSQSRPGILPNPYYGIHRFPPPFQSFPANAFSMRPSAKQDLRMPDVRRSQFPRPMTDVGRNPNQLLPPELMKLHQIKDGNNYATCIPCCQEIINQMQKVPVEFLEMLLLKAATEDVENLDAKTVSFIFDQIRKERAANDFKIEDFKYAIDAFVKVEDVNRAIELVFDMKKRGFKPPGKMLLQIRNGIFASPVEDANNLIKFCDELESSTLITKRLIEEILRHVSIEDFRAKTKSLKVLEILQEFKTPEKGVVSPTVQPITPMLTDDVTRLIKHIDETFPQENIPSDLVVRLIGCVKTSSQALSVITKLSGLPKNVLVSVPSDIWNAFFVETCNGPFANVQYANQIHGIVTDNGIKVMNRTLLEFATLLLNDGKQTTCKAAVEIIDRIQVNDVTEDDVTDEIKESLVSIIGNKRLCSAYDDCKTAMILIKSKRFVDEDKIIGVIDNLKSECCYQEVEDLMKELEKTDFTPSLPIYKSAISALEDWKENQDAFFHLIIRMKQKYPNYRIFDGSSEMTNSNEANMSNASTADHDSPQMTSPTIQQEAVVPPIPKTSETCNYFLDKVPYPNGSQPNLVHSMPAMPLKSPFEEIMNRQQYFANASNAAVPLSIANVRTANVLNEVAIEKTVNATQPDATVRPASSSSRSQSTECLYSQEYRKFYNKIVCASKSENVGEVFELYAQMRNSGVPIDNAILAVIYRSLLCEAPTKRFEHLANVIKGNIPSVQTIDDDDSGTDSLLLFQEDDQQNLGRLGVRLLFHCIEQDDLCEAFSLLYLLHGLNINYSLYGQAFDGGLSHTTCAVAMAAVKVCLGQEPPNLDGAMEVLRGASFGVPLESEDDTERNVLIEKLAKRLLNKEDYDDAFEVINHSDNQRGWSLDASECFNAILLRHSEENNVEDASKVYDFIDRNGIAKRHKAFRAYLNCHARADNIDTARLLFETGREMEVYPSQELSDPYFFELPCNLTQIEMLFMLEEHLRKIRRTVYEGDGNIKPLMRSQTSFKIIFKENYELFETSKEQFAVAKENMIIVLSEMMKPPLRVIETEIPDEPLVIGLSSILGWYQNRTPASRNLSVTSNFAKDTVRRTVTLTGEEAPAQWAGAAVPETATEQLQPIWNDPTTPDITTIMSSQNQEITLAVCKRVDYYMSIERVEMADYEECCKTVARIFVKQNRGKTFEDKGTLFAQISLFVDNFFQEHGTFVRKQR